MLLTSLQRWQGTPLLLVPMIVGLLGLGFPAAAPAQVAPPPLSLKDVPAPEPTNLYAFLKGNPNGTPAERTEAAAAKRAAIVLGKALFWDMQVGSDNVQACATCHFNAGADIRRKNQITPGPDNIFGSSGIAGIPGHPNFAPNVTLAATDFPLHTRTDPTAPVEGLASEFANVTRDTNDVISSQGVRMGDDPLFQDPIFNWKNNDQRRVEPRNAPTMINAVFLLDMFWDGRASFIFNGVNPFGFRDRDAKVLRNLGTATAPNVQPVPVRIPFGAHASQAVGPPLSSFEMSGIIRSFPELGQKLLNPNLVPLAGPVKGQVVHPRDSVLGPYANATFVLNAQGKPTAKINPIPGLSKIAAPFVDTNGNGKLDYADMIRRAFRDVWWNGDPDHMANNFTLFFGLAVQLYQATLISDDTPFDRFMGANANVRGNGLPIAPDPTALTPKEQLGLQVFQQVGCINCHVLPETTNHVIRLLGVVAPNGVGNNPLDPVNILVPQALLELMPMGDGNLGVYDTGFYNIGVRPTEEDIGRAGKAPPTTGFAQGLPLSYVELALMKLNGQLPADVAQFVPDQGVVEVVQPDGTVVIQPLPLDQLFGQANNRFVTRGSFKVPNLRNQEFQGPYFHNGDSATLRHVLEFYTRGGNFPITNFAHLDADMAPIPDLRTLAPGDAGDVNLQALVAFLSRGLTDLRVATERAPFDHPQLFIPEGATGNNPGGDKFIELKATGATGGAAIPRFLGLNPQYPAAILP